MPDISKICFFSFPYSLRSIAFVEHGSDSSIGYGSSTFYVYIKKNYCNNTFLFLIIVIILISLIMAACLHYVMFNSTLLFENARAFSVRVSNAPCEWRNRMNSMSKSSEEQRGVPFFVRNTRSNSMSVVRWFFAIERCQPNFESLRYALIEANGEVISLAGFRDSKSKMASSCAVV